MRRLLILTLAALFLVLAACAPKPYEPAGEPTGNAALDDAVLIGCRADDIRTILKEMISEVESSYPDARPEKEK